MSDLGCVFVVDDDPAMRDALTTILSLEGYEVECFADGASFLRAAHKTLPRAVLLDVHMPGHSGIDVLQHLPAASYKAPIFVISGQGDIPMAVSAVKKGAYDFIEKPFSADTLIAAIENAAKAFQEKDENTKVHAQFDILTARENGVLHEIVEGASNKEIAKKLSISPRTVEVHRARILEKLGARNAADLVRIVMENK